MVQRTRRRNESLLPDPSIEDIRRETAAIRQSWSPREMRRRSHYRAIPWFPPILAVRDLPDVNVESET